LLTMRDIKQVTPSGEVVFGLKNRTWNDKKLLEQQKESWANSVNQYLELAQVPSRIDHRTPTDRVPQIHIGTAAWEMEKRGIPTERGDLHRSIAEDNRTILLHRNEIALATQRSIEIELRLEVERREAAQREAEKRGQKPTSERHTRRNHLNRIVDRANELLQDAIEPPQRPAQSQSQPDPTVKLPIVPEAQPAWKEISTKEEQE
jgi:MobA/MobL family